jgi:hypothetical protein
VQRGEGHRGAQQGEHLRIEHGVVDQLRAAVHHAMPDGVGIAQAGGGQCVHGQVQRGGVVGHHALAGADDVPRLVAQRPAPGLAGHTFDEHGRHLAWRARVHPERRGLEGGRSRVDAQHGAHRASRGAQAVRVQSRTSGMSSRCVRM